MNRAPDTLPPAEDWRAHAVCRTANDPELWFPVGENTTAWQNAAAAKATCYGCPVIDQCLRWALDNREDVGIWGGLDEAERRRLHGRRASTGVPPKPRRTPESILAERTTALAGGHLIWTGPTSSPTSFHGWDFTPPQLAWFAAYGVRPDSVLTRTCDVPGCVAAAHRLDAAGRAALHGTRAAYLAHRRRGEEACADCLAANRESQVKQRKKCGTQAAYRQHRNRGEVPCQPCKDAHAKTNRRLRKAAKKRAPKPVKVAAPKPKAKAAPRPRRVAQCGTESGYRAHRRKQEPVCQPCQDAHAERSRQARARRADAPRVVVQCGTNSGYQTHRNRHEPVCDPCREAHAESSRQYRANEQAKPPVSGPDCGTTSGLRAHLRRGESPCQPCVDARTRADWLIRTTAPERSAA